MKLNLGCGFNKVDGHVNVDKYPHANPDLLIDLEQTPWPLAANAAGHVLLNHCLEHLGQNTDTFLNIVKEIYRVCRDGATVQINVPHPRHDNFINDPTHVRAITPALLQLFSKAQCIEFVTRNGSNSPLALYLDVDFEITGIVTLLEPEYDEALRSGALSETDVQNLLRQRNNVAHEYRITLRAIKSPAATRAYCETLFASGFAHFQAQQDAKAAQLCQYVLQLDPGHFESLHLCGLIAHRRGDIDGACWFLEAATASEPDNPVAQYNAGALFQQKGHLDEALKRFTRAIALNPDYVAAHCRMGSVLAALDRPEEGLDYSIRATELAPNDGEAFLECGRILCQLAIYPMAAECLDKARQLGADEAEIDLWQSRLALAQDGQADPHAVLSDETLLQSGNRLKAAGQFASAAVHYRRLIERDGGNLVARYHLAQCCYELEQADLAAAQYEEIIARDPAAAEAHFNLGVILHEAQELPAAIAAYRRAIALRPDHPDTHYNLGNALKEQNLPDEAIAEYDLAIGLRPDYASAHLNRALALLLKGDYRQGWVAYEWRWQTRGLAAHQRNFPQPLWLGKEALKGRSILLHGEQGLGDSLQFCRYAKDVQALGARVILEVPASLIPVLKGLPGVDQLLARGSPLPNFDYHCPLLSLPLALALEIARMPPPAPYLHADTGQVAHWRSLLGEQRKPRVGIAWRGSAVNTNDARRSMALNELLPALVADCDYYCLQKDFSPEDLAQLQDAPHLRCFADQLPDFGATAALCELMDVIVCVDTSIAHLAGALGKPVLLMLPFNPDWRWLLAREDSIWYPRVRVLRQPSAGDWPAVASAVRDALLQLAAGD